MANPVRIVVLGAGYGGVLTAKKLAKKLGKNGAAEVTLIDKNTYHTMLTELHEVAAGRVPEESIRLDLKTIFKGRAVNVVQDNILKVDLENKQLVSEKATYSYDYLVLGTGSKPTFFGVKGAETHCFQLWSYDDAVRLKEHFLAQFRLASNESDPEVRKELLRFVVVGCGFTGVEMAGELAEWVPRLCREYHVDRGDVEVMAVDVLPKVLPIFPDNLIDKAERHMKKLGIKIHTATGVSEVGEDFAVITNLGKVKTRTVIWTAGIEGSDLAGGLALRKEARHRVVTNQYLQAENHPEVFVVGDNAYVIAGPENRLVPQMVENAEHSAASVAGNIALSVAGAPLKPYAPEFHGAMVCIGGRYGVAHLGLPGKFFGLSGFFAMFVKHFINIVYFLQVAGLAKCWSYFKLEFFHVPDRRSFVGGLISKATPNFWVVPLRLFLGFKWFEEGWAKLPRLLADPSDIFLIPAPIADGVSAATQAAGEAMAQAAPAVADATSAATQAAGEAMAQAAPAAADVVAAATGAAQSGGGEAASQWGAALPVPDFISDITSWTMGIFFHTADGGFTVLAQIFQGGMILGELAVGLCLMAGLFTLPASVVAVLMGMMIWASGMAPVEMLWYLAAAFATMGGSGSVLGLDYYVLPWLKTQWNRIPLVRKWYLFID